MPHKKSQGQFVHLSITMRWGVREQLDLLGKKIKERTGVEANRSRLLAILASLAYEAEQGIDYSNIRDEVTLQRELALAISRKAKHEQEPPGSL